MNFPRGLERFLHLFSICHIKFFNYQNIHIQSLTSPISIYNSSTSLSENELLPNLKSLCIALFSIFPIEKNLQVYFINSDADLEGRQRDFRLENYYTGPIYDVLIEKNSLSKSIWTKKYKLLYSLGAFSHGLILNIKETISSTYLEDIVEIVDKLELRHKFVTQKINLELLVNFQYLYKLEEHIQGLSSIDKIKNAKWGFTHSWGVHPVGDVQWDNLKLYNTSNNIDQLLIAREVVGGNITYYEEGIMPMILFEEFDGQFMVRKVINQFGFITCSSKGKPDFKDITMLNVVFQFLSAFSTEVYMGIGITYILISYVILGFTYHFLLKPNIHVERRLTWHPFWWGLRALLRQSDNRRWNSERFGFMTFVAYPLSQASLIFSNGFERNILRVIGMVAIFNPFVFEDTTILNLTNQGLKILPSRTALDHYHRNEIPFQLQKLLQNNRALVYLSYLEDIDEYYDKIKTRYCMPGWVRRGIVRDRRRTTMFGWNIYMWADNRILKRFTVVEAESGIMHRLLSKKSKRQDTSNNNNINALNMHSNLRYVFICHFFSTFVIFGVVCLEKLWILWMERRKIKPSTTMERLIENCSECSSRIFQWCWGKL